MLEVGLYGPFLGGLWCSLHRICGPFCMHELQIQGFDIYMTVVCIRRVCQNFFWLWGGERGGGVFIDLISSFFSLPLIFKPEAVDENLSASTLL